MHYELSRALHFVGVILWLGGTIASALLASYAGQAGINVAAPARRFLSRIATPAMVAAWLGGLGMLLPMWQLLYARAFWMHGKLTLVFLASGLSGAISAALRRAEGGEVPVAKMRGFALALLFILLAVIALVVIKPGPAATAVG